MSSPVESSVRPEAIAALAEPDSQVQRGISNRKPGGPRFEPMWDAILRAACAGSGA